MKCLIFLFSLICTANLGFSQITINNSQSCNVNVEIVSFNTSCSGTAAISNIYSFNSTTYITPPPPPGYCDTYAIITFWNGSPADICGPKIIVQHNTLTACGCPIIHPQNVPMISSCCNSTSIDFATPSLLIIN